MPWQGPIRLRVYLDRPGGPLDSDLPPEISGLYVVTERKWSIEPNRLSGPLWAGRAHAPKAGGLRSRIGDLISSLCGFHGTFAGRHIGGTFINMDCIRKNGLSPLDVFIGWLPMHNATLDVLKAGEDDLIKQLDPPCNRKKPKKRGCFKRRAQGRAYPNRVRTNER